MSFAINDGRLDIRDVGLLEVQGKVPAEVLDQIVVLVLRLRQGTLQGRQEQRPLLFRHTEASQELLGQTLPADLVVGLVPCTRAGDVETRDEDLNTL